MLGFLCEHHPLQLLKHQSKSRELTKVIELVGKIGQRVELALWLLTGKLVSTRTGEVMEFLTFEDETGQVETTFSRRCTGPMRIFEKRVCLIW